LVPIITMSMPSTATISSALANAAAFRNWTITCGIVERSVRLRGREGAEMQAEARRHRAGAERQEFRRLDYGARLVGRADMGRDHASAPPSSTRVMYSACSGTRTTRDGRLQARQQIWLVVSIERCSAPYPRKCIEARGLGDLSDLDLADQPTVIDATTSPRLASP